MKKKINIRLEEYYFFWQFAVLTLASIGRIINFKCSSDIVAESKRGGATLYHSQETGHCKSKGVDGHCNPFC